MDARERFLAVLNDQPVDRLPFFEEEIREDVLDTWRQQGMPAGVTAETCRGFFGLDRMETVPVRFSPPAGAIETAKDFQRIIRNYQEHPVEFLTVEYWQEKAQQYKERDFPLGLIGWNGFQLPLFPPSPAKEHNEWDNLINLYLQIKDDPAAVKDALSFIADYYISIASLALRHLALDYVIISEPIASTTGPVISPGDFMHLVLPQYPKLIAAYRAMGMPKIIFSSISNVKSLLPAVVASGIDGLRITQIMNAGIDYVEIARQHPNLALIGGIESIALLRDKRTIVEEVQRKAIPLLARRRWLPTLDDNVRVNIPYRSFLTYRQTLLGCCTNGGQQTYGSG